MAPYRRASSSPFLPLPLLIILAPIVFFIFVFFVVPPFLSLTSQILRPSAVKKSWDSFNVLLVLFAIICGVFARKNDDSSDSTEEQAPAVASSKENEESVMAQQWPFGFPEKKIYDPMRSTPERGAGRLRRSSSSYPDLKHESLVVNGDDGFQFRFFDDFDLNRYRSRSPEKIIPIDSFSLHSLPNGSSPRKSPTPPPPPPPPPVTVHKQSRSYQTIRRQEDGESLIGEKSETPTLPVTVRKQSRSYHTIRRKEDAEPLVGEKSEKRAEITKVQIPPPPPPPLPPSPARPARVQWEAKDGKVERRKSNAKKEIAMVLASLYKQSKRKKKEKTQKSDDDVASSSSPEQPVYNTRPPPSPPPPPPPLPPPPSMFHSFFKKASRGKKVHSVAASLSLMPAASFPARSLKGKSPIPPPPPPRPSRRKNSTNDGRPPLPTKVRSFPDMEETVNTGGQSPFIPIPPPPPPFKMPATKFVIRGDFARIQSTNSSRCNSPEREEVEPPLLKEDLQSANKSEDNKGNSVFCPSPDVNTKADNFIARLRDEWRLEKMNSMQEKTRSLPAPG